MLDGFSAARHAHARRVRNQSAPHKTNHENGVSRRPALLGGSLIRLPTGLLVAETGQMTEGNWQYDFINQKPERPLEDAEVPTWVLGRLDGRIADLSRKGFHRATLHVLARK